MSLPEPPQQGELAGMRWRIVLGPPGAPQCWPLAEDTAVYQVARLLAEARRTWPDAYAQCRPVGRWRDANPRRRGPAAGDGDGDFDADVRQVLEYVSAGRQFVDVEPYPEAAARRALGRILDDELARELQASPAGDGPDVPSTGHDLREQIATVMASAWQKAYETTDDHDEAAFVQRGTRLALDAVVAVVAPWLIVAPK